MASVKYNVVVYQSGGKGKDDFPLRIGAVIQGKNGPFLKLNAIPVDWDGVANLFVPDEEGGKGRDRDQDREMRDERPSRRERNRDQGGDDE
jgi:hypothetical protein